MTDHWELMDLYKALFALAAGVILGLERELKDKSAGVKTISVITLGSALISIISYKVTGANFDPTRIASYIVSGIGFLGAGVIFKDGVNVSGLTTASVIWLAAAVGMSIGFGEIYLAATFLGVSLMIIYVGNLATSFFPGAKMSRLISISLSNSTIDRREQIVADVKQLVERCEEKKLLKDDDKIVLILDVIIEKDHVKALEDYLLESKEIKEFEL